MGCTEPTVVLWRQRFTDEGLAVTLSRSLEELGVTQWSSGSLLNMVEILSGTITRQAIKAKDSALTRH